MPHIAIMLPQVETATQDPEPKERKKRDLSKFTFKHLKTMEAHTENLLEQIRAELQEREDDSDGIAPGKMTERQHENWSKKMIAASEGNGS